MLIYLAMYMLVSSLCFSIVWHRENPNDLTYRAMGLIYFAGPLLLFAQVFLNTKNVITKTLK